MPFYRRRIYRRRPYAGRRRPYRRTYGMRRRRYTRRNAVPRFAEVKKVLITSTDASIDQGGVLFQLSQVAQGDTVSARQGNAIIARYLKFACSLENSDGGLSTGTATKIRVIIFQDTQQNATAPTAAQLLQDTTAGNQFIQSPLNAAYPGRFRVWYDKVHVMNSLTANSMGEPFIVKRYFEFYKRLNTKITYTGAAASDVSNNNIYVLFVTDQDEDGAYNVSSRLGFVDV